MSETKYKKGQKAKYAESLADDKDETVTKSRKTCETTVEIDAVIHSSPFPQENEPCGSILPSVLPRVFDDPAEFFNEYGFRKTEKEEDRDRDMTAVKEDAMEQKAAAEQRLKWIAAIEFAHPEVKNEMKWSDVKTDRLTSDKFEALIREGGIPHAMRPFIWPRLSGGTDKAKEAPYTYEDVLRHSSSDNPSIGVQIEKDLLRTLPNNICFYRKISVGIESLRRVLKAVAYIYPDLGYCQGMGVVVSTLLLFLPEETTFWTMTSLIEDILPANYYSANLLGLQADERVCRHLMKTHVPDLNKCLVDYDVEASLVLINWFLTLLGSICKTKTLLRIWDIVFYQGSVVLFRTILSMMKMKEEELVDLAESTKSSADIFNALCQIPSTLSDDDRLFEYVRSFEFSITDHLINELRKKYQAILMADQGTIVNVATDTNLPKQKVQRRKVARSKSIIQNMFSSSDKAENDPKTKNIRQTELLVDLRESILQVCRYFSECDQELALTIVNQADYTPQSHETDMSNFLSGRRQGKKRARALLDFARQDEDELGFRKNDIITIISEKDEHCWVGEVNGLRGWFPAKFVEVVDERGKTYSLYGDEEVSSEITEYIRGRLANSFRQVMDHGIRQNALIPTATYHPWSFIEDIAYHSVQKHFNAVYSRLTLCNSFSLDQDGKILTPEELLFRSVQLVNDTHNRVSAHQDVKLRSLLVLGVNEQCLHLWFDIICGTNETIKEKYYHSWSFLRTPAWRQIKCELRLLAQFAFKLSPTFELDALSKNGPSRKPGMLSSAKKKMMAQVVGVDKGAFQNGDEPLKEGVKDILIKHHLFSWDL
ncbi:hypothetical protein PENTCL1PPCAC_28057 [Pristionchus entomophagus]|uniref:RUN and TBC1 domain-containing protein 3 n=1 Tax=Pristionchus entomophagus TaxID=358040 RepID=A0AAV5UGQ7_9BILA|nr:hypothetical protein PENTCL1PPCAC_28057 [Pristionchus entomophagus]